MCFAKRLSGFSAAMDWRPIEFVDLPSVRSCSLCNVVPKETFLLECPHALCSDCYQAVLQGNRCCPLDGESIQESEVQICTFKPSHLQKWKVRCCNSSNGCDFVGNVDQVKNHFLSNCAFHVVSCNRCNATVLRRNILGHYNEQRCQTGSSSTDGSRLSTGRNDIETKIDESLETVMQRLCVIDTQVNYHAAGIASAKMVLDRVLEQLERTSRDVTQVAAGMTSLQSEYQELRAPLHPSTQEIQRVMDYLYTIEPKLDIVKSIVNFGTNEAWCHVRNFAMFCREARSKKMARLTDVFVVCGYSTKLKVVLERTNGVTYLGLYLTIIESSDDSILKWPFLNPYYFVLLHSSDRKKNIRKYYDSTETFRRCCVPDTRMRPTSQSAFFGDPKFCKLDDIINSGFICDDAVCIGVELGVLGL